MAESPLDKNCQHLQQTWSELQIPDQLFGGQIKVTMTMSKPTVSTIPLNSCESRMEQLRCDVFA